MALYHDAKISPSKAEILATWVPTQSWCPDPDAPVVVLGAFRFDDPQHEVGMETHIVACGDALVQVPLTYRAAPLDAGTETVFVGEMTHTALGNRWVYDGFTDERYVTMLAAVTMTGQGEALGMVEYDGQWFIAPTHVRIRGGGWGQKRVSVDGFAPFESTTNAVVFRNSLFELTAHRRLVPGEQPPMGLTATWADQSDPVVLAEVRTLDA